MATPGPGPAAKATGLGSGYAKLWAAAWVSFVGDGIYGTALPLLAATLTRDPLGVAAVEVASQLPWLLFALPAGACWIRGTAPSLWLTDAYRALVLTALTVAILVGWASIALLGAAGFLLAVGGTLFTPATMSILPGLVSRDPAQLERANSRLAAAQTVGDNFLGPPAGGALFSLARSVPFAADAISFAASAAMLASIKGRYAPTPDPQQDHTECRPAAASEGDQEGLRWLAGQRLLRTLATMKRHHQPGLRGHDGHHGLLFAQDGRPASAASAMGCCGPGSPPAPCSAAWSPPGSAASWVTAGCCWSARPASAPPPWASAPAPAHGSPAPSWPSSA